MQLERAHIEDPGKDKLFKAGLLTIEERYLDYFLDNGRLQDNCRLFFIKKTGDCHFSFLSNSNLPVFIRQECTQLFQEIFS